MNSTSRFISRGLVELMLLYAFIFTVLSGLLSAVASALHTTQVCIAILSYPLESPYIDKAVPK